jgi:hypothetical protein
MKVFINFSTGISTPCFFNNIHHMRSELEKWVKIGWLTEEAAAEYLETWALAERLENRQGGQK